MELGYIIDTNSIIDYLSNKLPEEFVENILNDVINLKPNISLITKIELLGFSSDKDAVVLLTDFVNDCNIITLTNEVVEETIKIRKQYKIKLPDAIIAATAIVNKYKLITRNINDFKKIASLKCINPYD